MDQNLHLHKKSKMESSNARRAPSASGGNGLNFVNNKAYVFTKLLFPNLLWPLSNVVIKTVRV